MEISRPRPTGSSTYTKGGIGNGNLYQGFDIAFRDEAEFRQFLKDYEGTVFKGNWDNQIVLWCFRREYVFLPSAEWER